MATYRFDRLLVTTQPERKLGGLYGGRAATQPSLLFHLQGCLSSNAC